MLFSLVALSLAEAPDEAVSIDTNNAVVTMVSPRVAELSLTRVSMGSAWAVRDGRGNAVDAKTWAVLTGDPAVLDKIAESRKRGRRLGWALIGGGVAVAGASVVPALMLEETLGANESTVGFDEIGARNDARVATAFAMLGAGTLLAASGVGAHAVADHRALDLSRQMDAAAADAAIAAWNLKLAETLTVEVPPAPAKKPAAGGDAEGAGTAEGAVPAEATAPAETTKPAEAKAPAETTKPAEGTAPADGAEAGGAAPTGAAPR